MNEKIEVLLKQAGFRVFGDKIVAGDNGSSGNATVCAQKLINLVVQECKKALDPTDDARVSTIAEESTRYKCVLMLDSVLEELNLTYKA